MICQRCGIKIEHGVGSNHRTVADCIQASRRDALQRAEIAPPSLPKGKSALHHGEAGKGSLAAYGRAGNGNLEFKGGKVRK